MTYSLFKLKLELKRYIYFIIRTSYIINYYINKLKIFIFFFLNCQISEYYLSY